MSEFTYQDYTKLSTNSFSSGDRPKIGFFKLADDGDEALVRINCSSVDDLKMATIHRLDAAHHWMSVGCLNDFNGNGDNCPFCRAAAEGNPVVTRASKKVYVEMLVSYKDRTTGAYSAPIPVIWERPAPFARELAGKLAKYGNLKECLLTITRNGKARSADTTYSIDYAIPTIFKPEMVPADFSAFDNFEVSKKGFWIKSAADMQTLLDTGSFPEIGSPSNVSNVANKSYSTPAVSTPAHTAPTFNTTVPTPPSATIPPTAPIIEETPAIETKIESEPAQPVRSFGGFSF